MLFVQTLPFLNIKKDPTFYLARQTISITDCYFFDKTLSLKPVLKYFNNKIMSALFFAGGLLKNSIPFKKLNFDVYLISKLSYFFTLYLALINLNLKVLKILLVWVYIVR